MDAKLAISITKLTEAAISGNMESVLAYAKQLRTRLSELGDADVAEQIDTCLDQTTAKKSGITRIARTTPVIPVDSESRLPVADETIAAESVRVHLPHDASIAVDRFLTCIKNADKLLDRGVSAPASLIMDGPPGCGKTLVAKHIAGELGLPLLTARTDSLISSYLGSTSKNLRMLFEHAASRKCVLFLDEFDAIAKMRDDKGELGELKRVVISLLQNIDANGHEYILLAATNHPHLLDPAVWRRFSCSITIGLPDENSRFEMLNDFLGKHIADDILATVAALSDGLSGSQLRLLCDEALRETALQNHDEVQSDTIARFMAETFSEKRGMSRNDAIKTLCEKTKNKNHKKNQTSVGHLFGVSQSTVSRILKGSMNGART